MSHCTCSEAGLGAAVSGAQVRPDKPMNLITIEQEPVIGETPPRAFGNWLIPNPLLYVRNHFSVPHIECDTWGPCVIG